MPKWTGTLIGGGIGWVFGGPIGALIGAVVGNMVDADEKPRYQRQQGRRFHQQRQRPHRRQQTKPGDFAVSMLVLFAYVTKADNRIMSAEIQYVKQYLIKKFGTQNAQELMYIYKEVLEKDYNINQITQQINSHLDYYSKLEMLHILFGVAKADQKILDSEVQAISFIANQLGISASDFKSIQAIFIKKNDQDYRILNVNETATDAEVKKAYRKMAVKYHPDKVANLGEDIQKVAEEKFKAVNNAYQNIKQARGF